MKQSRGNVQKLVTYSAIYKPEISAVVVVCLFVCLLLLSVTGGKDIILGNYGSAWRLHRKLLITAMRQYLSDATLIQQTILQEAAGLLTSMKSHEGRPFDPEHIFTHAVANVICKITFGADYDMSNADMEKLLLLNQRFFERNEDIQTVLMLEFFPIMEYIPELPPNKRIFAIRDETFEIIRTLLNKRKKGFDPTKPVQDLLSGLLVETEKATEQGSEDLRTLLSEDYLLNTIEDMFLAGYETTSTSLRWAIAFLVNHPQYQTDIQRSLDEVIGRERIPNMEDRSKLPLIHATIMEVLRLGNILPQAIPHLTTRDTSLCGYRVPKDTVVIVDTQAVHLDPTCWDEPTVFNPYRHIDEDGKLISDRGNFYPFGAGRRVCAGEPLAKLELFFFLCSMLQKFTFVPVDEESMPSWKEGRNGGTRHPYPYKIRAMQRC